MSDEKKYFENHGFNLDNKTTVMELKHMERQIVSKKESVPQLFKAIKEGNLDGVKNLLQHTTEHINSCFYGGLTPLHAACHLQQVEILKLLVDHGAKIDTLDSLGNSPLHVATREKWETGIKELLDHGASPNQMSEPPMDIAGQLRETPLHAAVRTGEVSSVAVMLKHKPNFSIRDRNNYTIFHLAAATRNDHILKQLLMESESREVLEDLKHDTDSLYHAALPSSSTVDNEHQVLKVMQLVYKCNKDVDVVNFHGETPIFLACQLGLPNVVKFLLEQGADPTKITQQCQTTLHAASKAGCYTTLEILLAIPKVKELITKQDIDKRTPFYFAVISASVECCKVLLFNGDHLCSTGWEGLSNYALVIQKLPSAMKLFRELFDSGIKLSNNHQFHPDFTITFDYSVLVSSERDELQSSIASELSGTPLESLIKHPLIESFLFIKWSRIRNIFYLNVIHYILYVLLHTIFIGLTYGSYQVDWGGHLGWYHVIKMAHLVFVISIAIPSISIGIADIRKYLIQWETYVAITAIVTSVIVTFVTTDMFINRKSSPLANRNLVNNGTLISHELLLEDGLASVSVLFVWLELMMLLGRLPALGSYILMFTEVSTSLIKFITAFLSLIIGLSMCFYVLFRNLRTNVFKTYALSFSKIIMMMIGEVEFNEFLDQDDGNPDNENIEYASFFYLLVINIFVFVMTVVTHNLLIGLAVNDIPNLTRLGKISRLVKQATYLKAYETVSAFVYKQKFVPSKLRTYFLSSSSIKTMMTIYPNKEKMFNKYFDKIPEETLKEAINLCICKTGEDFHTSSDVDISHQLKAFQMRYSNDRRAERHKFEDIIRGVNQLESKVNQEMAQLAENRILLEKLLRHMENFELKQEINQVKQGLKKVSE